MKKNSLKLLVLLFCVVAAMPFTSCNNDEQNTKTIVGSWDCVSSYIGNYDNNGELDRETIDRYKGTVVIFKEDGTCKTDGNIWRCYPDYAVVDEGSWSIIDDSLYIYGRNVWDIQQLTNSKLKLYKEIYDDYDETFYKYSLEFKKK